MSDSSQANASFAAQLRAGAPLVGTVLSSPDPVLAERAAQAFDFAWIDLEHSALSVRDALVLAVALRAGGAASLVRLPRFDSELLTAVLDTGVDGVVAPKVSCAADAAALVRSLRYPPAGSRGFAPRRASGGQAAAGAGLRSDVACIVQIETRAALAELDAIAATEGLDGLVVGLADLSLELGCPLDMEADALADAARSVGETAARNGVPWGLAAGTLPPWVSASWQAGGDMFVFSSDLRLYAETVDVAARRLRRLREEAVTASTNEPGVPT